MTVPIDRAALLLGVPVDDVTVADAVDRIAAMVEDGRSTGRTHQVATVNVDFVVNAVGDVRLLDILQRSDLAIPDGMPLVWASQLMGSPLRERTTGIDLVPAIVRRAAADGHRVVFFGAAPGVAARAAQIMADRDPGVTISAIEGPMVGPDGTMEAEAGAAVLAEIRAGRPDIVCVALGNPKQERWIERHGATVGAPVYVGVGGSLDFITGVTRRAPVWMQRSGLEWLHRAASEPRRLVGRYARDGRVFVPRVLAQAWRGRRRGPAVAPVVAEASGGSVTLRLLGPLPAAHHEPLILACLRSGRSLTVDTSALGELDNVTAAALVALVRQGRRTGAVVDVVAVPAGATGLVPATSSGLFAAR